VRQDFFTPRELAEIARARGITSFPATERGVRLLAKREGWNDLPVRLVRRRTGGDGGRPAFEYHLSLLPEFMRGVIGAAAHKAVLTVRATETAIVEQRQIAAIRTSGLGARARAVMEARAEILRSIEGFAISNGRSRAWGVARFLDAQAAHAARQEIAVRRDRGEILTPQEAVLLASASPLTAVDGFDLRPDRLEQANDRRGDPRVGRSTIYGWFKARDERGVAALAPMPAKEAQPIPSAFGEFLKFYAVPSKPTVAAAHAAYMATVEARRGIQPAPVTLPQARHILRDRLNNIEKNVGREGFLTLRSRMAYVQRSTDDMWPTTVYTADGKTFDAEVADPVSRRPMRPEITSVLDVATRKCVGYAISRKENVIAVTEGLRRACVSHGIPAIFYTDRGAGYKNKTFDADAGGLMGRLGITKMHALPYNSQAKGLIERFNAVWNDLARTLPTYLGEEMDKEAKQKVHKATRTDVRAFGQSHLLPSWDLFIAMCEAKIAEYNDRPHTGLPRFEDQATGNLRHMSPNEAWAAHVASGFEPVTVHADEEEDLFRPYEIRMVRRALVEWNTNSYFHADLEAWHERRVMVGYDLHQADRVWVREYDEDTGQPGQLICVAEFGGNSQRYVPLTAQRAAEEGRVKGQLRRLSKKTEAALDQLKVPLLEQGMPMPEADFRPVSTRVSEVASVRIETGPVHSDQGAANQPAALTITSDAELARLCLADPGQLTPGRAQLLREVMSRRNGRELLRISGVDLDELDDLLRSAA